MDETKETRQDSSRTIEDSSKRDEGITSEKTPETFTKEQREKAVSDALAVAGRTAKDFEKREAANKATEERIAQERRDKDAAELEAAKDDKDAYSAIQERQKHRETKSELARAKQELDAEREKSKEASTQAQEFERTQKAAEIAVKYGVDFSTLVKFTDGSPEAMEELAKNLPKKGGGTQPLKSDSGRTIGGEGWRDLSPDAKLRKALSQ